MSPLRWNVLTDRWIPLDDGHGNPSYASYPELMTGARDAPDLVHPRDDCRFFARMLLSALTQALFPAADRKELRQRIKSPLPSDLVLRRIEEVQDDFELVDKKNPWMQAVAPHDESGVNKTRGLLLDSAKHLLFRPAVVPNALCPACAVVILYGFQAFAPSGGRGYSPGVRGSPPTTTLVVVPGSLRASTWANTLHSRTVETIVYGDEPKRPWASHAPGKDGEMIGLVEGLFWKPRSIRLAATSIAAACSACGREAPVMVEAGDVAPHQKRTGGLFRHPMSPCKCRSDKSTELRYRNLESDRPAWTSLVDWLSATEGDSACTGAVAPAPVVSQWVEQLSPPDEPTALLVLDYGTNKASIVRRIAEMFPLSLRLAGRDKRSVADGVRQCVADTEKALSLLRKACVRLHLKARPNERLSKTRGQRERNEMDRLHDATATFWQRTEPFFWAAYEAFTGENPDAGASAQAELRAQTRGIALELFDTWAAPSLGDPSRIAHVVQARAWLSRQLPAAHSPVNPSGEGAP